jgi:hypothetical protein
VAVIGPINKIFEFLIAAIFVIFGMLATQVYVQQKHELTQQAFSAQGMLEFGGFKPVLMAPEGTMGFNPPERA